MRSSFGEPGFHAVCEVASKAVEDAQTPSIATGHPVGSPTPFWPNSLLIHPFSWARTVILLGNFSLGMSLFWKLHMVAAFCHWQLCRASLCTFDILHPLYAQRCFLHPFGMSSSPKIPIVFPLFAQYFQLFFFFAQNFLANFATKQQ